MDAHLRDLRYFAAVAENLHFGRAAETLHVSQPALSKQIHALENQLRARLFDRDRRSVRLTATGEALLPHARELLAVWENAERAVNEAAAAERAILVVGMSTGIGRGLLPAVRARFGAAAPQARLSLRQVSWDDPTGGLAAPAGSPTATDAAFVWLPLPEPRRYQWIAVATEPRRLLLPASHRLATADGLDFTDLLDEPFLALPRSAGKLRDYWLAVDARGGRPAVVGAEIASTDETIEALTAGLGICLAAAGNVHLFRNDAIAIRDVRGVTPSKLVLAWRRDDRRPLLRTLIVCTRASRPS